MNHYHSLVLLLLLQILLCFSIFDHVEAQQRNFSPEDRPSSGDAVTNFKPSLAVVIGILCVMFSLTFLLLIYAKFCHSGSFVYRDPNRSNPRLIRSTSRFSGIDKTVIESLPFFRFSSLKGSKQGLECSVCLSKFEDIEILRLLPKCKHAFHINCIDEWFEKHSSCPLCRFKVNIEDPSIFTYSNSMRLLFNQQSELREDSNVEIFVEREAGSAPSSRFGSFRKIIKQSNDKEEEVLIQEDDDDDDQKKILHKLNHKIVVSDVIFKNRWSSASSSDLMFLKSEMLNSMSSNRFCTIDLEANDNIEQFSTTRGIDHENEEMIRIKEEMEMKRLFETKISSSITTTSTSRTIDPSTERRSVSEITARPRFQDLSMKNRIGNERRRKIWFPIARRTVQWFADRERKSQQQQSQMNTTQPQQLDV